MKLFQVTLIALVLGCSGPLAAQSSPTQIYINFSGDDSVGQKFVFDLKEDINKSSRYQLNELPGKGIDLAIVSVNALDNGNISAVSIVGTISSTERCPLSTVQIYHTVLAVGRNKSSEMAEQILANIDKQLADMRWLFDKLSEQPSKHPAKAVAK